MIYSVRINDKEYEVEVERGKANILRTVSPPLTPSSTQSAETLPQKVAISVSNVPVAPDSSSGTKVCAPMPGTILEIINAVGQKVMQGDVLLVLEAMKMENEIIASTNGTIKQILTTKGASVATGDTLIIIE